MRNYGRITPTEPILAEFFIYTIPPYCIPNHHSPSNPPSLMHLHQWANDAEYRTIRAGGGCDLQDTKYCPTPAGTAAAAANAFAIAEV